MRTLTERLRDGSARYGSVTNGQDINPGDRVRFKRVVDPGDEKIIMKVIEIRGDQAFVESLAGLSFNPTGQYPISDLEKIR